MIDRTVFNRALDILDEAGWVQGNAVDPDREPVGFEHVCLWMAVVRAIRDTIPINDSAPMYMHFSPYSIAIAAELGLSTLRAPTCIFEWNDHPNRTADDVRTVLSSLANGDN